MKHMLNIVQDDVKQLELSRLKLMQLELEIGRVRKQVNQN